MEKYTIKCTCEQTKKALELGAPIVNKYVMGEDGLIKHYELIPPTAEQLLGWLEGQIGIESIEVYREGYTWTYYICLYIGGLTAQNFLSRAEATIAAIDAALDYLTNNKK